MGCWLLVVGCWLLSATDGMEPFLSNFCVTYIYFALVDVPIYRMCEIKAIVPYKRGTYKLTDSNATTDKAFLLAIGSSQVTKRMDLISNSRINQAELQRYLDDITEHDKKKGTSTKVVTKDVSIACVFDICKLFNNHGGSCCLAYCRNHDVEELLPTIS